MPPIILLGLWTQMLSETGGLVERIMISGCDLHMMLCWLPPVGPADLRFKMNSCVYNFLHWHVWGLR